MNPHYVNKGGELNWLLDDLVGRVPRGQQGGHADAGRPGHRGVGRAVPRGRRAPGGAGGRLPEHGPQRRRSTPAAAGSGKPSSRWSRRSCSSARPAREPAWPCSATGDADIGLVAYEMAVLVRRSNEHLGVAARPSGETLQGGGYPQGGSNLPPGGGYEQGAPYQQGYPGPGPGNSYQAPQPRVAPPGTELRVCALPNACRESRPGAIPE